MIIILAPGHASLAQLEAIYRQQLNFELTPESFDAIRLSESRLIEKLESRETIYGVNTGFGKLASVRIDDQNLVSLQRNLVRSHCAGFGEPLSVDIVRLIMVLKCL
ncbi:MAG: histidine ammonia-lyase, partial [Arenicella sp.]